MSAGVASGEGRAQTSTRPTTGLEIHIRIAESWIGKDSRSKSEWVSRGYTYGMRFSAFLRCACLAVVVLASAGCVSKPTMHVNHAEISGFQAMTFPPSVLMTVVVDVYNPNGYDVAIRAMRGQVMMADRFSIPLDFRPPGDGLWLAAGKTTSVRAPVAIPVDVAMALLSESAAWPTISYRMIGKADVTASSTFHVEKDDYSVDERGTLTREQIAAIIPNTLLNTCPGCIPPLR